MTKHIYTWNLLTDDVSQVAERFELISLKSLTRGALDELWEKTNVLLPRNLLEAILNEESIAVVRRVLRKNSGVLLSPEDILGGIRRLLNETALAELEGVRISLPNRKPRRRRSKTIKEEVSQADPTPTQTEGEASESSPPLAAEPG